MTVPSSHPGSEKILPPPTVGGLQPGQGSMGRGDRCAARRVEAGGLECMGHGGNAPPPPPTT
eukprot:scaffold856_cov326-Pavlova_lutheri.AAC.25